jgi:Ca2+-binding RTX toxin-like protein
MDPVPAKIIVIVKPVLKVPEVVTYNDTVFNDNFAMATGKLLVTGGDPDKLKYSIMGGIDNGDGTISYINSFGELILTQAIGDYRFVPNDARIEALKRTFSVSFTVTAFDEISYDSETLTIKFVQKGATESNKNDTLIGGSANNSFDALAGDDIIKGFSGADTLTGGLGADKLTGGKGADSFKFNSPDETGITDNTRDVIVDFNHWQKDKIDLSTIDANTAVNGDNAFAAPVVGNHFAGTFTSPASLFFEQSTHILYANNDGDASADFSILLTGVNRLGVADFVL